MGRAIVNLMKAPFTTYTIPQGWNYCLGVSTPHLGITKYTRTVVFDPSCRYTLTNPVCTQDLNKVSGFSYGNHMTNSIRLGWKVVNDGDVQLWLYVHNNGKVKMKRIGKASTFFKYDTPIEFVLNHDVENNTAEAYVLYEGKEYVVTLPYTATPSVGYICKPYFGGDCSAPHTMSLKIFN